MLPGRPGAPVRPAWRSDATGGRSIEPRAERLVAAGVGAVSKSMGPGLVYTVPLTPGSMPGTHPASNDRFPSAMSLKVTLRRLPAHVLRSQPMDGEREHPDQEVRGRHLPGTPRVEAGPASPVPVAPGRWTSAPSLPFPSLDPGRESILLERNRAALAAEPRLAEMEQRLTDLSGAMVVLSVEPDLDELFGRGCAFSDANVLDGPMR